MSRTAEMFDKPRRPHRVLMHVFDAVDDDTVSFKCRKCGHRTGWIQITRTAARRMPCPKCNGSQLSEKQE